MIIPKRKAELRLCADNAELKRWAANTLPHLQEHLAVAEKLTAR